MVARRNAVFHQVALAVRRKYFAMPRGDAGRAQPGAGNGGEN
jgi:hypothetical protein